MGQYSSVSPKYFGPGWRTGFILCDCQGRRWAGQADMTRGTITLEQALLLFPTFLCTSLRDCLLTREAFPAVNSIFPFTALNASEGLRHETKWGMDDRPRTTLCALNFSQRWKWELWFASSLQSDLTFCLANTWANGKTRRRPVL